MKHHPCRTPSHRCGTLIALVVAPATLAACSASGSATGAGAVQRTPDLPAPDALPALLPVGINSHGFIADDAQEAAAWALLALVLALGASAAGGAAGSKLWPKDDAFVEVVRRKDA